MEREGSGEKYATFWCPSGIFPNSLALCEKSISSERFAWSLQTWASGNLHALFHPNLKTVIRSFEVLCATSDLCYSCFAALSVPSHDIFFHSFWHFSCEVISFSNSELENEEEGVKLLALIASHHFVSSSWGSFSGFVVLFCSFFFLNLRQR